MSHSHSGDQPPNRVSIFVWPALWFQVVTYMTIM